MMIKSLYKDLMNTLPQDLINLITSKIRTSDCLLLGIETADNQPYLDLITVKARLELALVNKNIGWVHQIIRYIDDKKVLTTYSIINLFIEPEPFHLFEYVVEKWKFGREGINELRQRHNYYIRGLQGDTALCNQLDPRYESEYIKGLSIGQHYQLFDQYATNPTLMWFNILNFEDEDYIISKIDSIKETIHREEWTAFANVVLKCKRFKVFQWILSNYGERMVNYTSCKNAYFVHIEQYKNQHYNDKIVLKSTIYQACIDSKFEVLDYIYNSVSPKYKKTFKTILSTSLITKELHEYANQTFNLNVELNEELINTVSKLKSHIDGYKYFYNEIDIVSLSFNIFDFIVVSLLKHYIDENNMCGFREVYNIAMNSKVLHPDKLLKAIGHVMEDRLMFSKVYNTYYNRFKIDDLRNLVNCASKTKQVKLNKTELIAILMDGCC